ncbi:MAG: 2-phospho-L-lactate guanylyltransferase [Egibacteraceae bacterium]
MAVTTIVPLKALAHAKSRMAGHLDEPGRRRLVAWMLDRVLDACLGAGAVSRVIVVAGDAQAAAEAVRWGVEVVVEPTAGLAAALAMGDRTAAGMHATLVVPADLPLATATDVDAVCAAGAHVPSVVVVATRDGGTGALLRRPGAVVGTAFGPGSAAAHLRLAAAAGIRPVRLDLPNLAFDVDTPDDLRALADGGGYSPGRSCTRDEGCRPCQVGLRS